MWKGTGLRVRGAVCLSAGLPELSKAWPSGSGAPTRVRSINPELSKAWPSGPGAPAGVRTINPEFWG